VTVADAAVAVPLERLEQLEARLREVEEANRRLAERNEKLETMVRSLVPAQLPSRPANEAQQPPGLDRALEGGVDSTEQPVPFRAGPEVPGAAPGVGDARTILDRSLEGGVDSTEQPVPFERRGGGGWRAGRVYFGPGFMIESPDEEYQLQFHNQTQLEERIYQQGGMKPAAGGFDIPRQRLIFTGRMTKWLEYDATVESAYGTINLLNAFLNFKYDDRLMMKFGRYKVPYLYEYFAIANVDLLTPERSLFGINYGFNRMPGAQLWGQLWDKRLDYAVGVFDGPRNQLIDFNNDKDIIAYLNFHPFDTDEAPGWIRHLNVGGSVGAGSQDNPVVPRGLKTSVSQSNNVLLDNIAPNWLVFNANVRERGYRALYALHASYFYKHLSLLGEWGQGYTDYGATDQPFNTRLPIAGWYVGAGYFLTGETVERRTQVKPLKPFNLASGKFGLGALEAVARYSTLDLGEEVFTRGLADPNLWSNRAWATDVGFNWYPSQYLKIYLIWQHSEFGNPAYFAPGRLQLTSDLFWLRFQLYF
jgi:phosphate-selective porin OprO/OprP